MLTSNQFCHVLFQIYNISNFFVVTPKFIILPKNPTEGFEGSSVRLDCGAEGDPAPTIQWDNKNVDFSQKRCDLITVIIDKHEPLNYLTDKS